MKLFKLCLALLIAFSITEVASGSAPPGTSKKEAYSYDKVNYEFDFSKLDFSINHFVVNNVTSDVSKEFVSKDAYTPDVTVNTADCKNIKRTTKITASDNTRKPYEFGENSKRYRCNSATIYLNN